MTNFKFQDTSPGTSKDDVLKRIRSGEVLLLDASLSYQSRFTGGEQVSHQVMQSLLDREVVAHPGLRGRAWTCVK